MGFKKNLGEYGEDIIADVFRNRGWYVENLNRTRRANLEWGDLYVVSPTRFAAFFSVKARTAIEHGNTRLIWNGSYDGKGRRHYSVALDKLRQWKYRLDGVGWISVAMNLDQTYSAFVGLPGQMIITGCSNMTSGPDEWKWSIPMRPMDRVNYFHLGSGRHDFNWLEYQDEWFYEPHRRWREQGTAPVIHEQKPKVRTRKALPELFPDVARQRLALWDIRNVFAGGHRCS